MRTETPIRQLPTHFKTVDEFEQWQRQYVHEGSYEFVRGRIIEKIEMKQNECLLLTFIAAFSADLCNYAQYYAANTRPYRRIRC